MRRASRALHAGGDQVVHLLLEMKADLLVEVLLHVAATKQRAQPQRDDVAPSVRRIATHVA